MVMLWSQGAQDTKAGNEVTTAPGPWDQQGAVDQQGQVVDLHAVSFVISGLRCRPQVWLLTLT